MGIAGGVVSILDWLKDKLPISNRLEAIKNEIDKLEKEKENLLHASTSAKSASRVVWIDDRLKLLYGRLRNASGSA